MRISKNLIISLFCFILTLVIASVVILYPVSHFELRNYLDYNLRDSLAGSIDTIYLGASHSTTSFIPQVIDDELGTFSYNLSSNMMDWDSRKYMLEMEIARNPVKTVVLEVSYDTLCRDEEAENGSGLETTIQRLGSLPKALDFMIENVRLNDWLNVYSRVLASCIAQWKDLLTQNTSQQIDYADRGFQGQPHRDVTLLKPPSEKNSVPADYQPESICMMEYLVTLCQQKNIEVIIVVTPLSDTMLYTHDGWDFFHDFMVEFCRKNGCALYDFNLLKEKFNLFSDNFSFLDNQHMSEQGAEAFSRVYAELIQKAESGEDVAGLFYPSYREMLLDSPYAH